MGIDLLDLTYRIERDLQVEMSMEDLQGLLHDQDIRVGDLYDLILNRLGMRDHSRHSMRLNWEVWSEMQNVLHCVTRRPLDEIRLGDALAELFPRETRRAQWDGLRQACRFRIPDLDYPRFVRVLGFQLAAGVVLIEQNQLWQIQVLRWFLPVLGLIGLWMVSETYLKLLSVCAPFRTQFPSGLRTVKDLCRNVLAVNYVEICEGNESVDVSHCPAIWEKLVTILVDTLGVKAQSVTFRSRLFHDLGAQ